jgi:HEPN domain-containing protein
MKNIDQIKQKLEDYEKRIQQLKVLELELTSLNTEGLEPEANAIKSKLKDPTKIDEIKTDLSTLKGKIKERAMKEQKRKAALNAINILKSKLNEADKLGLIVVTWSAESASSALHKGDYDNAANYATKSIKEIERNIKRYKDALDQINQSTSAIDNIRQVDVPVENPDELIKNAESELKAGNYEEATRSAKEAEEAALQIEKDYKARKEASELISSAESEIKEIESSGVKMLESSDNLIEWAKSELNKHNFEKAKGLANKANRIAIERKESYEKALDSITSVDAILNDAKGYGMTVSNAEEIVGDARKSLEEGNYEEAYNLSLEAERIAKETDKKYSAAKDRIESANATIENANEFCIVSEATTLLSQANTAFCAGSYDETVGYAKQAEELAKRIREESKPEIEVELPEKTFKPDYWKPLNLIIRNKGNAHARAVKINFSKEVEVKKLEEVNVNSREEKELQIGFRPVQVGEVPLETKITYKDFDNSEYKEEKTFWISVGERIEEKGKQSDVIKIKRGYEILQNNDLRFGIRIINNTDYAVMDAETILDYPRSLFALKDNVVQTLANIHPNGERSAKYILTPLGCIHNEKIDATIIYKDHTGEKQAVQMRPQEVHCVCPFLKEKAMREGEFAELANTHEHIQEGLSFSGISVNEIADFIKEACAHRLYVIVEHEIDTTKIVYLAGESIGDKAYYLLTAVIQPYKNLTQVALRAHSDKPYGLHGFLNEIVNSIRHLVASVQSAKEIGIIESKQVINIIDSVVQRTSFGRTDAEGTVAGTTSVNIEGSVVQRTEIGSVGECPNCGKEVQADEKFCKECGSRLE